jgi:hypothetical protein
MQEEKSILDLTSEIKHLLFQRNNFISMGQPVPDELEAKVVGLIQGQEIDRCVSFIKMSESQMEWLDKEIEHLEAQKKKFQGAIKDLKDLALTVMTEHKITKMEGERGHSFAIRKNESVNVTALDKIPSKYLRQKISIEADKNAIKAMLKAGEQIEGVEIVESYSVTVK